MKNPFKKKEKSELENQIDERIKKLDSSNNPEQDKQRIDNLKELIDAKTEYEGPRHTINPNTIISAVASIGGIVLVLQHEKFDVVTSKAWSLIQKVKG